MKKVIGYQIVNKKCEVPDGLWDFQIFKTLLEAFRYYTANRSKLKGKGFFISIIREGDIEKPIYIH